MNRKVLGIVLALSLAFIVLATGVAPAFALETYRLPHSYVGGTTFIDIAGHEPPMQIIVAHYAGGGDELWIQIEVSIPGHGVTWAPVAIVSDSPSVVAFWTDVWDVWTGLLGNIGLVKSCELQVCRIGKTVLAYWTVPIVSPEVILPPGCLLLKGYGCAYPENLVWHLPPDVTLGVDKVSFAAHATFVCPSWKYCGPVGDGGTTISTVNDVWATK
jgi:hypothetical protein